MEEIKLSAVKREDKGKGVAHKLRQAGSIPGVIYGPEIDPFALMINTRELANLIRKHGSSNMLIKLDVEGEKKSRNVIVRELQRDPVDGGFTHIDLYQVSPKKKLHLTTSIRLTGTPEGVKLGGILQHIIRELDISCLPGNIPDHVEVDVTALNIGDSIHVSDISIEKVEILTNPSRTLATVVPPTVIKKTVEEEAAEAEAAAEEEAEAAAGEGAEGEAKPEEGAEDKKE